MNEYEVPPTCRVYRNYRDARHWRKTRKEQAYKRRKIHQKHVKLEFSANGFSPTFLIHLFSYHYLTNFFLLCRTWCFNSSLPIFLPIIFFHIRKVSILFCPHLSPPFRFSTAFYSFFYQYGWAFLWTSKDILDARQQRTLAACKLPEQVSILVFPAEWSTVAK